MNDEYNGIQTCFKRIRGAAATSSGLSMTPASEIEKGRFSVILGPSGSGKSTTLNLLGGMDKATSGEIRIDGKRHIEDVCWAQLTRYRREDVGFVFQFYNLIPNLTAFENVDMAKKISKGQMDTAEALKAVGLEHRMKSFPSAAVRRRSCREFP